MKNRHSRTISAKIEGVKQHFSAGGVLVNDQNQVYLTYKKSRDEWALPKGGIEEGESKLEAAEREVKEETGYQNIEALISKLIKTSTWIFTHENSSEEEQKTTYYFLFRLKDESWIKTPEMEEEGFGGGWFSFEEAVEQASFGDVKEIIEAAKRESAIIKGIEEERKKIHSSTKEGRQ